MLPPKNPDSSFILMTSSRSNNNRPAVAGIQSNGVIATAKHYILNNQEDHRVSLSLTTLSLTTLSHPYAPNREYLLEDAAGLLPPPVEGGTKQRQRNPSWTFLCGSLLPSASADVCALLMTSSHFSEGQHVVQCRREDHHGDVLPAVPGSGRCRGRGNHVRV